MIRKYGVFFSSHRFAIACFSIILLAAFLRFYDIHNRFGLAYDQARDLLVARESIREAMLPLIGPFASAGQFVYGPQWYWILMAVLLISPSWFLMPWVFLGILSCFSVFLLMKTGELIGGRMLAIIVGILAAFSPGEIAQSVNLSSPSMSGIFSVIALYFFVKLLTKKKEMDVFLLSFFVSTAIMIHFQSIGLIPLLVIGFLLGKKTIKFSLVYILGFVIPLLPLFYFDITNNFLESRHVIEFYLHGQDRIYYPNRWLTYISVYWPAAWARIVGAHIVIGYIGFLSFFILFAMFLYKRRPNRIPLGISVFLCINIVLLRYYKGQLFDSYLVFLHGAVLLMMAIFIYYIYLWKKIAGIFFLFFVAMASLHGVYLESKGSANGTFLRSESVARVLEGKFPEKNFSVYDYRYQSPGVSLPIVLYLDYKQRVSETGVKIGVTSFADAASMSAFPIIDTSLDVALLDLSASSEGELEQVGWGGVNPSDVQRSTVLWYRKE
ncbi:MAG: hypothetical protein RLZZ455_1101 [Candidatus Parcubacteria bacterium]|jgi:hypothetical protein